MKIRSFTLRIPFLLLAASLLAIPAAAEDLTLTTGGRVNVELIGSQADFSNTLAVVSPAISVASSGCKIEGVTGLPGVPILSEKLAQRGCRVELDADPSTPGIQPFAAGTVLRFNLCAQSDSDAACEQVWSSRRALNPDGFDHVRTTPLHSGSFPGMIFQMAWEDFSGGGDMDFNDLIVVVRVVNDSDGDGLWDDWEMFGIDTDGDGIIDLDLPNLLPVDLNGDGDTDDPGERTSPSHKDIFVEIDYMDCAVAGGDCPAGDTHSHRPKDAAIRAAVRAFAAAGITLHVDISNAVAHQKALVLQCFNQDAGVGSFNDVKANPANFGPTNPRRFAFHYALFAHQQGFKGFSAGSSGCAELPGNDFLVTFGGWHVKDGDLDGDGLPEDNVGTIQEQAGTILHELGHNLNLGHGGGDGINNKPNYLSVMNYSFQLAGIGADPDGPGPLTARVEYSGLALADLNETDLNEMLGIGMVADNTRYFCPADLNIREVSAMGAINWNCNARSTDTGITSDINGDRVCVRAGDNGRLDTVPAVDDMVVGGEIWDGPNRRCDTSVSSDDEQVRPIANSQPNMLTGFNDLINLKLDFQNTHDFEDGVHSSTIEQVEIDFITHLKYQFDARLQDDSSGNLMLINSSTGEYRFSRCGSDTFALNGKGELIKKGFLLTLQHNQSDRRVRVTFDGGTNKGNASVQYFPLGKTFTIADRDTTNNTLRCP